MGNLRLYKLYLIFNPRISTLPVTAPGTIFWRQTSYRVIRIDLSGFPFNLMVICSLCSVERVYASIDIEAFLSINLREISRNMNFSSSAPNKTPN